MSVRLSALRRKVLSGMEGSLGLTKYRGKSADGYAYIIADNYATIFYTFTGAKTPRREKGTVSGV